MKIVNVRRISQVFFLFWFLWFCISMNLGDEWGQLRGWPVGWFLELDPLTGLGTLLTTRTLYKGLLWGVMTVVGTLFLGRFFCGWVCPFGTLHQVLGYLGHRKKSVPERARLNRYRKGQTVKYGILIVLLSAAAVDLARSVLVLPRTLPPIILIILLSGLFAIIWLAGKQITRGRKGSMALFTALATLWLAAGWILQPGAATSASLQIGLLDPIALLYRSVNLVIVPLMDNSIGILSPNPRYYTESGLIGVIFFSAILLNLVIPRFYCRFICPLGALFGVLSRYSLWRIGKKAADCTDCHLCETHCEGGCDPSRKIKTAECTLCMNCLTECHHDLVRYQTEPSATGEIPFPDVSRRVFFLALASGMMTIPTLRLGGNLGRAWHPGLIRPPGALGESDFLHRCIKCGQCMRICPTNVIQPAGMDFGFEGLWTPVLNFRIGSSGCQLNCIACGHVCPTSAIRAIPLSEKLGSGEFSRKGPVRIGTAFVDRGRCLPFAMNTPCIVCQENCPVSPKAITTREVLSRVDIPVLQVAAAGAFTIGFNGKPLIPGRYETGDYYIRINGGSDKMVRPVLTNTRQSITIPDSQPMDPPPGPGNVAELIIRLQRPHVDPSKCIGCGICEHECPVRGRRAIRVTADNESRDRDHGIIISA